MSADMKVRGEDVSIEKLVPLNERGISLDSNTGFRKIRASIGAIGLIEPLCVYPENGHYIILDGYLRFRACEQLGIKRLPCLLFETKEAYTYNRMVNRLSAVQETRMLRKALQTVDQATIAHVFGMKSIQHRLGTQLLKQLDPRVVEALDQNLVGRTCAQEMTLVKPERQREILAEMERTGDYGATFARALVVKTPKDLRASSRRRTDPWHRNAAQRGLVAKLEEVEKRHDFYSGLYSQYSTDLLKLVAFARKLITNDTTKVYMEEHFAEVLARFHEIIFEPSGVQKAK
jgi:hypothetical protein